MPMKLGELIVQEKLVTPEQLEEALVYQRQSGGRVGEILVKLGFATDEQIAEMVARKYDVPVIDLPSLPIDGSVLKLIPAETAQAYQLFPVSASGATLTVAMADPTNVFAIDDLRFMTGYNIEPVVAPGAAVMEAIEKHYESAHTRQVHDAIREAEDIDLEKLERSSDEAPVVKLCNLILTDALRRDSSEIHIEPFEHEVRVRFRIDGVLWIGSNQARAAKRATTLVTGDE